MTKSESSAAAAGCNLCGSWRYETIADKDRQGGPLETVLCTDCGLVFSHPIPTDEDLHTFYAHEYRRSYKGVERPKAKHIYRSAVRALERLPQVQALLPPRGRVLDIGSGGGEFVYLLKTHGYEVTGVEPDQGYGGYSIEEYGIDVRLGLFTEADLSASHFDLVTAHHVVEHLRDPAAVFAKVHRLLKTGGRFVVEVPNVESTYHAPHHKWHFAHIFNFNPVALENMGRKAGFEVQASLQQPRTQHVNVTFLKTEAHCRPEPGESNFRRVKRALDGYRNRHHYFSWMPLKRFAGNLGRWLREQSAVRPDTPGKTILDAVYGGASQGRRAA